MESAYKAQEIAVPEERIESCIFLIRGVKVMISSHLAELYEVEPRSLVQAVKRKLKRFPEDFMFQLTWEEASLLTAQSAILKEQSERNSRLQSVILKDQAAPALRSCLMPSAN
jgi:hypothetical protein